MTPGGQSSATARSVRIRRAPTSEQVSEHIRRLIFDGELRPGDRIPQDAIAADLGVSRIPVREALIEMARDGLVVNEPHIGAFVGEFDEQVIRDHFEIVAMLQGMAAERLTESHDEALFEQLRVLAERVASSDDPDEVHADAVEFQRVINHGGGSARLRAALRALGRMLPTGVFAGIPGSVDVQRDAVAGMWAALEQRSGALIKERILAANRARADLVIAELRARGTLP
ncbi:MAG TPA: GntR family transcriptional regulator [Acidimicrobiales bacterium]